MAVNEKKQQATSVAKDVSLGEKISDTPLGSIYQAMFGDQPAIIEFFSTLDPQSQELAAERAAVIAQLYEAEPFKIKTGQASDGTLYVATIGVEALTLRQKMAQWAAEPNPPTVTQRLALIQKLAHLLIQANQLGLLHQNLSPTMVAITADLKPILLGLAIPPDSIKTEGRHIEVSSYQVYLDYISPEQAQENKVLVQSHIYTLGIMLYELLGNTRPRLPVSRWDVFELEWLPKETPLREVRQDLQEETYQAVATALWRRPWDRPDSLEEWLTLLTAASQAEESPQRKGVALPLPATQLALLGGALLVVLLLGFLLIRGRQNNVTTADSGESAAVVAPVVETATAEPTATLPPTETPTTLPTATPATIALLTTELAAPLVLGEPVSLEWLWEDDLEEGDQFVVYLIANDEPTAVSTQAEAAADGQYAYTLETADLEEGVAYGWFVALETAASEQIGLSDPVPLDFVVATATHTPTVMPTSTIAPTSTNTPEPTSTPECVVSPPPGWSRYTIQEGDSLYQLAVDANFDPDYVLGINCVTVNTVLSIGQQVWLPQLPATATPLPSPTPEPSSGGGGNGGGNGGGGGGGNPEPPRATATPPPPPGG